MKAKLVNNLDIDNPEKESFSIRITGLYRPIFVADKNGLITSSDKTHIRRLVKEFNKEFKANPHIEQMLREDKTIILLTL